MEELKIAITIVAVVLSLVALLVNQFSARRRDIAGIRPILVFEYEKTGWAVHNIGNGPAMDVIFTRLNQGKVHDHTRLPALATASSFPLHFAKHDNTHTFAVTYRDTEERPYSSRSSNDLSTAQVGFSAPRPDIPVVTRWWERSEADE